MIAAIVCITVLALAVVFVLAMRQRAFRRQFNYSPKQDCTLGSLASPNLSVLPTAQEDGFVIPDFGPATTSALLELKLKARITGEFRDPAIEIRTGTFRDLQVLERGVDGVRFLNVSRLLKSGVKPGDFVVLRGKRATWGIPSVRLHLYSESLRPDDRVLIVAPHPDDAEIAAFGLYSDTSAAVVTVTAGDGSDRYNGLNGTTLRLPRALVARMRIWDSIVVPQMGGVGPDRSVNLCYPDGELRGLFQRSSANVDDNGSAEIDFPALRRLNQSRLLRNEGTCKWRSLVDDLIHILMVVKPTVIATPHPSLDPHPDHFYTTVAVSQAVQGAGLDYGRFYFYANHNRRSEMWPFGPAGSGVAMLPTFQDDVIECDSVYSHPLTTERQLEKFLALEAMHDLRVLESPERRTLANQGRRIRAEISAALQESSNPMTCYLRRAVRPDEVFWVASFERGRRLCQQILETQAPRG